MRVAVISDVHGNAFALEAVLRELRRAAPDLILNLGDQIEGSADPARAAALQAGLGALEVRGNNEEKLWPGGRRAPISVALGTWLDTQLDAAALSRLADLPLTARALEGRLLACHGTPDSAWDMLLWHWQDAPEGPPGHGFYRARDPRELRAVIEPLAAAVVVCGHTHRPGATRVGDTLVVNAGSVSDQVDSDPRARWTVLEEKAGHWSVDFRTVPYDIEAAVRWSALHSPFGDGEAALLRTGTMSGRGG
ncbi:metallophosphoesterase family protein [Deinococcus aerophilus]|uniref:Metallophosphoesterase n=1 Tax=Deinococcus aerophilus TaxID=522488 RepID=A0ABQ2GJH5_9DEIO|nr:metallophosphoesterase family protein [Deinococcus aerophilus]GGL97613.1 metallophosphoesterase [Deinococcus aerophilus]